MCYSNILNFKNKTEHLSPGKITKLAVDKHDIFAGFKKYNERIFESFDEYGRKHIFFFDQYFRLHREDGPAVDGDQDKRFYLFGKEYDMDKWFVNLPEPSCNTVDLGALQKYCYGESPW